jgi:hypothetical protein
MKPPPYEFLARMGRVLNSRQARTVVVTGNIYDLYYLEPDDKYVSLLDFLVAKWNLPGVILMVYEINGPIRCARAADMAKVREAWTKWRVGLTPDEIAIKRMLDGPKAASHETAAAESFDANLQAAIGNPTLALELLRQMCLCSRTVFDGRPILKENLVILIEGADLIVPEGPILSLSDVDRHRVSICHDWFSDPGFMDGDDCVVLLSESRSLLNQRVSRLPQVLEIQAPYPDQPTRSHFISWFGGRREDNPVQLWGTREDLASISAGLSIQAILQLLKGAVHDNRKLEQQDVIAKVEEFIQSQLGEDIVEFKKPSHSLDDVIGYARLKQFLKEDLIPRFQSGGDDALPGAAVCGPIGGGKTFIFEAMAAELDVVVLVLKNIRSQWFGQTDVIFERLRRVLEALAKVVIFVDEADTQFGGVGPDAHETERRLTGKIQAMMSDTRLRGKVIWLLMTARIHLLSPDIRRPGRTGDLIIPVLDPVGDDRRPFIEWTLAPATGGALSEKDWREFDGLTKGYAASNFAALRSELKARAKKAGGKLAMEDVRKVVKDLIPPDIAETRRYQTLQALVNCTRRSLLPNPESTDQDRQAWYDEIRKLELRGVR